MLSGEPFQHSGRQRERERFRDGKRGKKNRAQGGEGAGRGFAEEPFSSGAAAQAVPDVCAALHVISDRSEPHCYNQWHYLLLLFSLFLPLFSRSVSCRASSESLRCSGVIRCFGLTRDRNTDTHTHTHTHTRTKHNTLTGGIYRELQSARGGECDAEAQPS